MKNLKQSLIEKAMGNVENSVPDIFGEVPVIRIPETDADPKLVKQMDDLFKEVDKSFPLIVAPLKKPKTTKKQIVYAPAAVVTHHEQVIYGNVPSKSNCYRIITLTSKEGKIYSSLGKTQALKDYEKAFCIQCNKYRNAKIDGYFEFKMDVYYPNQRPDLDNSLKVTLDCLQSESVNAIKNDRNCIDIHVRKFLDPKNPRIEFTIKSVANAE